MVHYYDGVQDHFFRNLFKKGARVFIAEWGAYGNITSDVDYNTGNCIVTLDSGNQLRLCVYSDKNFHVVYPHEVGYRKKGSGK